MKLILAICVSFTIVYANIGIHDITNNPLAVIPLGQARVKTGNIRIIHPIKIDLLEQVLINNEAELKYHVNDNPLYNIIKLKVNKLHETFNKIRPHTNRERRWDTIGTIWKWIAGTPDAEDLRVINSTINSLIEQNNQQVLINDEIDKRLYDITRIANSVLQLEEERFHQRSNEIIQLIIISNLDTLQNYLETLEDAILLAKHGIPSSKLLSLDDLNQMVKFLAEHNIHVSSTEEMLIRSTAQVTMNKTHIIYMLKYPFESKHTFEYNYIDSIIKTDKRILLHHNYILKNNTHVFESSQPCEQIDNGNYLCDSIHLEPSSKCIQKLVHGHHSDCTYEKVYSDGIIKRIHDAVILINNATVRISSSCNNDTQFLTGSYIIHFEKCNIYINGEEFPNLEITINQHWG
ncbi:uncharacterized protein LOC121598393 [Anopheles merus]|uniref:uncharacterized protein LOC121598393 n=1 Tax=Anopheles merus TaxID=30066 RepID=UPI001BE456CA|nr:uncharacterized protein LOC121598393 [Anopheles merus]